MAIREIEPWPEVYGTSVGGRSHSFHGTGRGDPVLDSVQVVPGVVAPAPHHPGDAVQVIGRRDRVRVQQDQVGALAPPPRGP